MTKAFFFFYDKLHALIRIANIFYVGSFKNPPPGTPLTQPLPDPSLRLGQKVDDLYDPIARSNFRVVVIVPEEVELLDLSNLEEGKRMCWTLIDRKEGSWEAIDLWP